MNPSIELPPGSENFFKPNGDNFFKEVENLAKKYGAGVDIPSDYSKLASKYGGNTAKWMKTISEYVSKYPADFPKSAGQAVKNTAEAFPGESKMIMGLDAGLQAIRDQAGKYDYDTFAKPAPMETPYGKSFLSYTPEGKVAGKAGAALRGLGKVASKLAGPVGAALTALDLGQALSEVQDKGAAKIAEDYKNSQLSESEDTGDKMMIKMEPLERGVQKSQEYMTALKKEKQYTPEERMKLKEMLSKYRANAALRSEE